MLIEKLDQRITIEMTEMESGRLGQNLIAHFRLKTGKKILARCKTLPDLSGAHNVAWGWFGKDEITLTARQSALVNDWLKHQRKVARRREFFILQLIEKTRRMTDRISQDGARETMRRVCNAPHVPYVHRDGEILNDAEIERIITESWAQATPKSPITQPLVAV